jgi:hypothetical protein
MAFPDTPLDQRIEINVGSWVNITSFVQNRDGVTIKRGRADESSGTNPSVCTMSINNRDGRFSPRNPESPYYGVIGRNTPIRVSLPYGSSYLATNQSSGLTVGSAYVTTPDAAALDIVGDIDMRFEADLDTWFPSTALDLISKWNTTGNQRSYAMWLDQGYLKLSRSTDGTIGGTGTATSTARVPITSGRLAVRATLDVNDGAGNRVTTFYTSDSITGTWTQLGNTITTSGVIAIFASTAPLRLLDNPTADLGLDSVPGKVFKAQVLNGIAGSAVANPDFTTQTAGATSFTDAAGRTWTVTGTPTIDDRDYRFVGEVSAWPQKWDQSGTDIWTEIEAANVMRRLGQGASLLPSAWTTLMKSKTDTVAYWPAEDGESSTVLGSGLMTGKAMTVSGSPEFASYQGTFVATKPIMTINFAKLSGNITSYTATNTVAMTMFLAVPLAGIANGIVIARLSTQGTVRTIDLVYGTTGTLSVAAYDEDGVSLLASGATAFAINGKDLIVSCSATQNGADVDFQIQTYELAAGGFFTSAIFTLTTDTVTKATKIQVNPEARMDDVAIGQISVSSSNSFITTAALNAGSAFNGERAADRFSRLCSAAGVSYSTIGQVDSEQMGYQPPGTLLDLLKECAVVDDSILFEPRDFYGLGFRTRYSMHRQTAMATANYATNQMTTLEPTEDDQAIRNDVTVERKGGSSARVSLGTGPLSTLAAPNGVGTYDDEITLSLYVDSQTDNQAAWRVAVGTINEARYPEIEFNFTSPSIRNDATLTTALGRLDVGDRLVVTNPPTWGARESISQIAQGYTEFLNNFERTIKVNCSPATVYDSIGSYSAAVVSGGGQKKYKGGGSTLATSYNSTATSFSVATATGYALWTTDASQHPRDMIVAGERVTCTATSGTTSPQTFTVVRSVNGVVKSQASGASIDLLSPAKYTF